MKPRRVRFTVTAQRHVRREKTWWLENRTHTAVFATEFEEALRIPALLPGAGTLYPLAGVGGVRRLYLRKVACHRTLRGELVYQDPGADAYDQQQRTRTLRRLRQRAATLGFDLINRQTGEILEPCVS